MDNDFPPFSPNYRRGNDDISRIPDTDLRTRGYTFRELSSRRKDVTKPPTLPDLRWADSSFLTLPKINPPPASTTDDVGTDEGYLSSTDEGYLSNADTQSTRTTSTRNVTGGQQKSDQAVQDLSTIAPQSVRSETTSDTFRCTEVDCDFTGKTKSESKYVSFMEADSILMQF